MHRERMSGVDRAWLRMDSPRNPMVIVGLFSFAEPLAFGQLSRLFAQRLLRFERFRQRVEEDVTGHWWVDDPSFRLSNHLKRVRLDDAGEAALREHLDRLAAQPLDFSRPLWEMHFVERPGAPPAMAMRIHHCIADGVALVRVMLALAAQAPPPRRRKRAGPADESAWQAWLDAGWKALDQLGADLFEIRQLRADAALSRPEAALLVQRQDAPFAELERRVSAEGPSLAYPARERSNYRRRLRRLAERGELGFGALTPGAEARELAATAVTMKRRALARHGILAPTVADPRFQKLFAALAGDAADEAGLRLSLVTCAGRPIGIDISFDCLGRSFGHVIASDPDFEREGIGRILIHRAFAEARARGSTVFDLLAPADPYKREHADGSVAVYDLAMPLSRRARLVCALALPRLRPTLKTMAKRLPAAWVRRWLKVTRRSG